MDDQNNYDLKTRIFQGHDPATESIETGNLLSTARFAEKTTQQNVSFSERISNIIETLKKSLFGFENTEIPPIQNNELSLFKNIFFSPDYGDGFSTEQKQGVALYKGNQENVDFLSLPVSIGSVSDREIEKHTTLERVDNIGGGNFENALSGNPQDASPEKDEEISIIPSPPFNLISPIINVHIPSSQEGSPIDIDIVLTSDTSPGVTTIIIITGIPADALLSSGTKNSDGSWTVLPVDLPGLTLTLDSHFSGIFQILVEAVSKYQNIEKTTQTTIQAVINPVADTPHLSVSPASGNEDTAIPLSISASSDDLSETVSVTISGIPADATLSTGTHNGNGSWTLTQAQLSNLTLTPPLNYSGTLNLSVTASSNDNDDTATTAAVSLPVTISAVADTPNLSVSPASGNEDSAIPLSISAFSDDLSETVRVTISGVPSGATLSAGTDNGNGSWTLTQAQLSNLTLTPPPNFSGTLNLSVTATSDDKGSIATTTPLLLPVMVEGVATLPYLDTGNSSGIEDHPIALDIQSFLADNDGSELLTIIVFGIPSNFSLSAGIDNHDGSWTLQAEDLVDLKLIPANNFSGLLNLNVSAISTENGTSAIETKILTVHISGIADAPHLSSVPAHGSEGSAIPLSISSSLSNSNGSETLSIGISNLPPGFSLSAGIVDAQGNWLLSPSDLQDLKLLTTPDYSGNFDLILHAVASEENTQAHSLGHLNVTIDPIADPAILQATPAAGQEDMAINLNILASLTDLDGSETLEVKISDIPAGSILSAGHDNGDGSWTLSQAQLTNLTLTPPLNYSGNFTLNISATTIDGDDSQTVYLILPVSITPVADIPNISVLSAAGSEATPIALHISAPLNDLDGSELLAVKISGVPSGAVLSAGHYNGDGSWTLSQADLSNLTLTTPSHWSGQFNLLVSAISYDGLDSAFNTVQLPVTVTGVAGIPHLNLSAASGNEDTAIPLNISVSIDDVGGDEILTVTISNIPPGALLSAGTDNGDGTWTLTPNEVNNLSFLPPPDYSGTINLIVKATSVEGTETAEAIGNLAINIIGVPDTPLLNVAPAFGDENSSIPLNISAALTDIDGSELLSITITDVPSGAFLSAGIDNGNGSWTLTQAQLLGLTLTPPINYSGNIDLGVIATANEAGQAASTILSHLVVSVSGIATAPDLYVQNTNGTEDIPVPLDITAALNDLDGSEILTIIINGLPLGASLSAGTDKGNGSWILTQAQLANLTLTAPPDFSGNISLLVSAISSENGTTSAISKPLEISIAAVADTPHLTVSPASGNEDSTIPLNISAFSDDLSETVSVTISGVPSGATLSAGTYNGNGSWTLTQAQLTNLTLTPPLNYSGTLNLSVTASSNDNDDTATTAAVSLPVTISAVADTPNLSVSPASGNEDTAIPLNILASVTDSSEILSVTISGVPAGATLSAGTDNGNGSWTLTQAQLTNLTLTPPLNYSGTLNLSVTATSSAGSSHSSTQHNMTISINAVAESPVLSVLSSSGAEDTAIALNISSSLTDIDGSEKLSILISGVPSGAFLSAGLNNGNGSWTLSQGQLSGLKITPPVNWNGNINLNVTAIATENNGDYKTVSAPMTVSVSAIADTPLLTVQSANGKEDNAIPLSINAALRDNDGSETLVIQITGVPAGASLSAGTNNGNGSWTLNQNQLIGLRLNPPANSDVDFNLTVTAVSIEANGQTSSVSSNLAVNIIGVADTPVVSASNTSGAINSKVPITITGGASPDPSETLTYIVSGVPDGFSLTQGTNNGNNSWTLKPSELVGLRLVSPYGFEGRVTLAVKSVSHETDGDVAQSAPANFTVGIGNASGGMQINLGIGLGVSGIAAGTGVGIGLNTGNLTNGLVVMEDTVMPLPDAPLLLNLATGINLITVSGLPTNAGFSAGVNLNNGVWQLLPSHLTNLKLIVPPNSDEDFTLTFSTQVIVALATVTLTLATTVVHLVGVADMPTLSVANATGLEDSPGIAISVTSALTDTDGSETLSFTIKDLPPGFIPSIGINNGDGTWSLTKNEISSLSLKPPPNWSGDATYTIIATSTEREGDSTIKTATGHIHIDPVADAPIITSTLQSGTEDTALLLNLGISLADQDGSEQISAITISNLGAGFTLTGATNNGDGTWSVSPANMNNVKLIPPTNWSGDTNFTVSATSQEGATGPKASTHAVFSAHFETVADAPELHVSDATGTENTAIGLNINVGLNDLDGSERLSVMISNVPDHFIFSSGHNNGNGSWSFGKADLHDLKMTPKHNFTGDVHLNIDVFSEENNHTIATTHADLIVHVSPDT